MAKTRKRGGSAEAGRERAAELARRDAAAQRGPEPAAVSGEVAKGGEAPPAGPTVPGGGVVREDAPVELRLHGKGVVQHPTTRVRRASERPAPWADPALEMPPPSLRELEEEPLVIAGQAFRSRLIVGSGKYPDPTVMVAALRASGTEMVTVAVRRVDLARREGILNVLDPNEFFLLANTAGCFTAEEAIRYARLARAAGFNEWLKLEVIGDQETLLPDTQATLEAARALTGEGFKVMAYTNDDLVTSMRLEDAGCVSVMPLASPIGSGLGVVNPYFIREIKRRLSRSSDRRRRRRHRLGRVHHDGERRGRHPDEHRAGGGGRSRGDGARDALRGARRSARLPGRAHARPGDRGPLLSDPGNAGLTFRSRRFLQQPSW